MFLVVSFSMHVRLEQRHDQPVGGRINSDFIANADDGSAQPRQLEASAAFEILEHRRPGVRR